MRKPLFQIALVFVIISQGAAAQTWTCGDTLIDTRDNKLYGTVQIGSDCWLKENLDYGIYAASDTTSSTHADVSNNGIVEKYCQNNDSNNCAIYGGLYDWNEMMNYNPGDPQGICPNGWHVSTDADWIAAISASGGSISGFYGTGGNALKATGQGFGAGAGTNTSGFSAMAGGDRDAFGIFYGLGLRFIFWTATPDTTKKMYLLYAENDSINRYGNAQTITGFSCRCVQNPPGSGMNDVNSDDRLVTVYPNPSQRELYIRIDRLFVSATYTIYNSLGQEIKKGIFENSGEQVPLNALATGSYMLVLQLDDTVIKKPFVISGH